MTAIVAAVLVFVAVSALVMALTARAPSRRLEQRLANLSASGETSSPVGSVLRVDKGTFPGLRRLVTGTAWADRARRDLDHAGLRLKASEYLMARIFVAAFFGVVLVLLVDGSLGFVLAIVAGAIGFMVPAWVVMNRRNGRQEAISGQLVESLTLVSNSLRSGFAFTQALELAAKQSESPMRDELERLIRDTSLGAPMDIALQEMAERAGSYDLEMVVTTILIQRETGGNLSEILDNVVATIREREALHREIRSLTASQRLTGLILSIYPLLLGAGLFLIQPEIMSGLWKTEAGRIMLLIATVLMVAGTVSMRRILRLEV